MTQGLTLSAKQHVFRCLTDNIGVLLHDQATGATAAIDAPDEDAILRALDETGWQLTDILVTHRHWDHVQAIPNLKKRFPLRVTAPLKAGDAVPDVDKTVYEGDIIMVGSLKATVLETPGHCQDHVSYWFKQLSILCCGDTLFKLGCGRMMEGDYASYWRTLSRLMQLPDETVLYCGHDYTLSNARFALAVDPENEDVKQALHMAEQHAQAQLLIKTTTLGQEKALNPFLRAGDPKMANLIKQKDSSPEQIFASLREWKNRF